MYFYCVKASEVYVLIFVAISFVVAHGFIFFLVKWLFLCLMLVHSILLECMYSS